MFVRVPAERTALKRMDESHMIEQKVPMKRRHISTGMHDTTPQTAATCIVRTPNLNEHNSKWEHKRK